MRIFWIAILYLLAILLVVGRIGAALGHYDNRDFLIGLLNLYPPTSFERFGYDLASLAEDLIVFLAIRHAARGIQEHRNARTAATR